jgi:hypothetical protein
MKISKGALEDSQEPNIKQDDINFYKVFLNQAIKDTQEMHWRVGGPIIKIDEESAKDVVQNAIFSYLKRRGKEINEVLPSVKTRNRQS